MCSQFGPILKVVAYIVNIIRWSIPILLVVLITIDMVKAVTSNDNKQINEAKQNSVNRLIYAVIIYLVPTIIILIFRLVGNNFAGDDLNGIVDWIGCFNSYF